MRILFGTRTFDIISVEDDNEYHRYIKIIAREKVAT
jgi:head-tail adaptor